MEAVVTNNPYQIGGNVLNTGLIDNLPADACVEVPCMVNAKGINPCHVELNIDDIRSMCDQLIDAHGEYMAMYK